MGKSDYPNHVTNKKTGFIESLAYKNAFNSEKKLAFLELLKKGYTPVTAAQELRIHKDTFKKHFRFDHVFREAVQEAREFFGEKLETVSQINALEPKQILERMFQLKAIFPSKYGDPRWRSTGQMTINLVFPRKALDEVKKRNEVLDAELANSATKIPLFSVGKKENE